MFDEVSLLAHYLMATLSLFYTSSLVVGTSAVLFLSLGGSNDITSMPLGTFFLGSSFVSMAMTPWIFPRWGRKRGFLTGIATSLVGGTALGAIAVKTSSPGLYIVSTFFFGSATGIGYALRFAAVEVVPSSFASRAVTLVVSGGVIAAFAGPEAAGATRDTFGQDLTYMVVFLMTGVFNVCNLVCIILVPFPDDKDATAPVISGVAAANADGGSDKTRTQTTSTSLSLRELRKLVSNRAFMIPMLVATAGWACMSMPMSLLRVVMTQLGYSTTDSLRVIELHFLGMYAPGFFTGNLIKRYGAKRVCYLSVVVFGIAEGLSFLPDEEEDESILLWSITLILVGMAWNFAFSASTVWLLQNGQSEHKATLQAANDCIMFFLAGVWTVSSSYIFEAGGSGIDGWYTLNWVVVGLVGFTGVLLTLDEFVENQSG